MQRFGNERQRPLAAPFVKIRRSLTAGPNAWCSTKYPTGITIRVNSMFAVRPPMTMIASGCCIWSPGPMPRASGNKPRIAARLVMRMGRERVWPARSNAGPQFHALLEKLLNVLDKDDAVLHVQADEQDLCRCNWRH